MQTPMPRTSHRASLALDFSSVNTRDTFKLHPTSTTWLTSFLNLIVYTGKVPSSWSSSTTIPIFKNKRDPAVCSNYRPIRLLSHTMNIFGRIIDKRLCSIIHWAPTNVDSWRVVAPSTQFMQLGYHSKNTMRERNHCTLPSWILRKLLTVYYTR